MCVIVSETKRRGCPERASKLRRQDHVLHVSSFSSFKQCKLLSLELIEDSIKQNQNLFGPYLSSPSEWSLIPEPYDVWSYETWSEFSEKPLIKQMCND